jgi:hypothetical protein
MGTQVNEEERPMRRLNSFRAGLALLATAALFGCGGGSSGPVDSSGGSTPPPGQPGGTLPPPAAQTGSVGIVITDAPSLAWDRALATITSISLLSDDGRVILWEGEEIIDFLDLADYSEIFWIAEGVPVGSYEKIRLQVSRLELQKVDDEGEVIESALTKLVANGKIDLNPRGQFTVVGSEMLFVQLDWDMKKSLKIVEAGNSGNIIVRPVVFVKILGDDPFQRFTRVHGIVRELTDGGFVLCQTHLLSAHKAHEELRHCIDVLLADGAGLFDPAADPTTEDAILPGIELTAIGLLVRLQPGVNPLALEDRRMGDVALEGHVVQIGPLGTFTRNPATATSSVADNSRFGLAPVSGELNAGLLQAGTKIGDRYASFLGQDAIAAGVRGVFEGVPDTDEADLLKTTFIVLDLDEPVDQLSGVIQAIDLDAASLVLTVENLGDRCVAAGDAAIYLLAESEESLVSTQVTLGDLAAGMSAQAFGSDGPGGCFAASVIYATAGN